jgi:RNA 2',3'-cyclic 3'-phosphodiesterase
MSDQRRLFIGVPVSMRTLDALAGATETLARRAQNARLAVRWLAPATYHVTLKFLGWCRPETVDAVVDAARRVAGTIEPFRFSAARLGAFPSAQKATIVWAGIDDAAGRVAALADKVEQEMSGLGFARETRRFHPHVTIGRIREPADVADVLLPMSEQAFSETRVDNLVVYESRTISSGSEYSVVAQMPLGAAHLPPKRQTTGLERASAGDTTADGE